MFKMYKIAAICLILILGTSSACFAQDITNFNNLIENGKKLDGKTVTIKGEAIGEIMNRGDYSWVNISDGSNAIGIWGKSSIINKITVLGNYKQKGDIVKIQGVFHRACSTHGGDMDIHITNLSVITKGDKAAQPLNYIKIKFMSLLILISLFTALVYWYKQKHQA